MITDACASLKGWLSPVLVLVFMVGGVAAAQTTITKCQGADGKWYYGTVADEKCATSDITELNNAGAKVGVDTAPLAAEEIAAAQRKKEQAAADRLRLERQQQEDRRVLAAYDSEQTLIGARDARVAAIDERIASYQQFRAHLSDTLAKRHADLKSTSLSGPGRTAVEQQIGMLNSELDQYTKAVEDAEQERAQVTEHYADELRHYRAALARRDDG